MLIFAIISSIITGVLVLCLVALKTEVDELRHRVRTAESVAREIGGKLKLPIENGYGTTIHTSDAVHAILRHLKMKFQYLPGTGSSVVLVKQGASKKA